MPSGGFTYATVRLQDLQSQMPTEWRLTLVLPQKVQTYLECWVISIFLTDLRSEAPYLSAIHGKHHSRVTKSLLACGHSNALSLKHLGLAITISTPHDQSRGKSYSITVRAWNS